MTTTTPLAPAEPTPATSAATANQAGSAPRGHIGRIVTLTILGGALAAVAAVTGPFAGAEEHVITGAVLAAVRILLGAARRVELAVGPISRSAGPSCRPP